MKQPVHALGAPTLEPARSYMGTINPLARLLALAIFSTALIVTVDWVSGLTAIALELTIFAATGVGVARLWRYFWVLLLVAPLSAVSIVLYGAPGGDTYFQWGLIHVSDNSLLLGVGICLRVIAMALPALALFIDTDPIQVGDALAQNGRMPARFVIAALTSVRMVQRLVRDWQVLGQARRARGLDDTGKLRRIRQMGFNLLVMALRRGADLATAMEARGFGADIARTWARPAVWRMRDTVAVFVAIVAAGLALGCAVWAGTFRWFGL